MLTITCYKSGALQICDDTAGEVHLPQETANRLIMAARMKTVDEFLDKLSNLLPHEALAGHISRLIENTQGSERWNLKEKFARLPTVVPGHVVSRPDEISEVVEISD